jgi:hypothetical protein
VTKNHLKNLFVVCAVLFFTYRAFAANVKEQVKEWNFLVFLNGVNSLDAFGTLNLNQMESVGSSDKVNIIVQWGSLERSDVQRLLVQKDNDTDNVTSPVVQNLGSVDMGDWHQLVNFAQWAHANYPAKHTMLIVWNHGSGWHRPEVRPLDISYDERTGNVITTEQLGQAMQQISADLGKKVDVYASDACLMAMVEVADEMANSTDYFVGSQDLEPGEGIPYDVFLTSWMANPLMAPKDLAKLLSKEYKAAYTGGIYGDQPVTMSVYDMKELPAYRQAIQKMTQEMLKMSPDQLKTAKAAIQETKYFHDLDYRDLMDFTNRLEKASILTKSVADFRSAQQRFVVANDQNQDNVSFGLSIWLPDSLANYNAYAGRYQDLSFNKNTGWKQFLEKLY